MRQELTTFARRHNQPHLRHVTAGFQTPQTYGALTLTGGTSALPLAVALGLSRETPRLPGELRRRAVVVLGLFFLAGISVLDRRPGVAAASPWGSTHCVRLVRSGLSADSWHDSVSTTVPRHECASPCGSGGRTFFELYGLRHTSSERHALPS